MNWCVKVPSSSVLMPTSASSAICCTSFSVTMVHPVYLVYVILHGRFITVFSGKLLQFLPDPAPVLHGFLLVPGEILQGCGVLRPSLSGIFRCPPCTFSSAGIARAARTTRQVQVRHGEVGVVQRGNGLVAGCLLLRGRRNPGQGLLQAWSVPRYREYPPKSSSAPCPVMMRRYPCSPAQRAIKYWVRAMPVLTGSFFGIALITTGSASSISVRRDDDRRAGKAEQLRRMPCLPEVMGAFKPDCHAFAPGQVCNKRRVHAPGEGGDALVAAEPDRGDDGLLKRQVRHQPARWCPVLSLPQMSVPFGQSPCMIPKWSRARHPPNRRKNSPPNRSTSSGGWRRSLPLLLRSGGVRPVPPIR